MTWLKNLGLQIRAGRKAAGLTQQQLADKTSVTRERVSYIEAGKYKPTVNVVIEIAKALGRDLFIAGYRIGPGSPLPKPRRVPEQFCLNLGAEYRLPDARLRIQPSKTVLITGVIRRSRSA